LIRGLNPITVEISLTEVGRAVFSAVNPFGGLDSSGAAV